MRKETERGIKEFGNLTHSSFDFDKFIHTNIYEEIFIPICKVIFKPNQHEVYIASTTKLLLVLTTGRFFLCNLSFVLILDTQKQQRQYFQNIL